jgi:hypothetical protein
MTDMTAKIRRRILNLCSGTGAWTVPYAEAGYEVICVTLPESDVRTFQPPDGVHGIVASPPCVEFSIAKGGSPRDFRVGLETVDACLRVIRECQLRDERLAFWCLENPRGLLRQFLGKPTLTVHYWWYGDVFDKPTDLWGYFEHPKRLYSEPPVLLQSIKGFGNWGPKAAQRRGTTPPCFANAFFKVNQ